MKALYNGQKYGLFYIYGLVKWLQERAIAPKPDDMSLIPGTHMEEGKN